jgi:hypothetical protein
MSEELKLQKGVTLEALNGSSIEYPVRVGAAMVNRIGKTTVMFDGANPSGVMIQDSLTDHGQRRLVGIRWETDLDGFREIELHPDPKVAVFRLNREFEW